MSCTLLQYCKKFTVMQIKLVVVVVVVVVKTGAFALYARKKLRNLKMPSG